MRTMAVGLLLLWGTGEALGCAACEDRDALQQTFTSNAEAEASNATAAAQSTEPSAPETPQPQAPRERLTVEASASSGSSGAFAPRKKPTYLRSFNELR